MNTPSNHPETDVFLELHVPDFDLVRGFYGKLWFVEQWSEKKNGGYLVMRKGSSVLNFYGGTTHVSKHSHFWQFDPDTPRGYGVEIILLVESIDGYYQQIVHDVPDAIVAELKLKPWWRKDFRIVDPFGYYIRISELYNWIER